MKGACDSIQLKYNEWMISNIDIYCDGLLNTSAVRLKYTVTICNKVIRKTMH